jgi:hypothetical protein
MIYNRLLIEYGLESCLRFVMMEVFIEIKMGYYLIYQMEFIKSIFIQHQD